jgi:hypothetical protein
MEAEGNAGAGQDIADLVRSCRSLRTDHRNRLETLAPLAPPSIERLGHRPVELLIRRPRRLGHEEVHPP